jgi:hypothetical protein
MRLTVGMLILLALASTVRASDDFFEKRIRPLLVEHCYQCHSAQSERLKGDLRLDSRAAMLKGGSTGPAIVPGKPDDSFLIKAVRHHDKDLQMPPKSRLPDAAVGDLTEWVAIGAPWPNDIAHADAPVPNSVDAKNHWAFQPVRPPKPPEVRQGGWVRNDIDRFVLAKLEQNNLSPSPEADKRTLIRRLTFDLIGLPPTSAEVESFLADTSDSAYEKLIDRLLASPHYGERQARHWLDLARYADTNGADENYAYPNAWRYRDYVVRSLNADKPYNQFVAEQLAGDLLLSSNSQLTTLNSELLTATGFLVLGPKMLAEQDKPKLVMDLVDEQVDAVGQTFLALTLGCARCHDHKFDPVSAADYYALAGIFKSTKTMANLGFVSEWLERELPGDEGRAAAKELADNIEQAKADVETAKKAKDEKAGAEAKKRLADLQKMKSPIPRVMAVAEDKPVDLPIHLRGSHLTLAKQPIPRGFLSILGGHRVTAPGSGRLELARWITDPANPLTARVMVNRIWQQHFGQGLVSTPSNFGLRGSPPSHPELLDHLAAQFIQNGWSIKHLHKQILLSATYCQSSRITHHAAGSVDPDNRLLSRQNPRRLEAEPIRDALLFVSNNLDLTIGGALEMPDNNKYTKLNDDASAYATNRRALYIPVARSRMYDFFPTFDYVDAAVHIDKRPTTTVPQQALFMLNSDFVAKQAETLSNEFRSLPIDHATRIRLAYERLFSRPPTASELTRALRHLSETNYPSLFRVLLASNEFIFIN